MTRLRIMEIERRLKRADDLKKQEAQLKDGESAMTSSVALSSSASSSSSTDDSITEVVISEDRSVPLHES